VSELVRKLPAVSGTIAARIAVLVTGLAASIVTARALGPEGRGQYYAIMTLGALISQFGNLGLSSSNTYLAARDPRISWSLVVNGVWVCIAVGLATAVFIFAAGRVISEWLHVPPSLLWAACVIGPAMLCFTLGSSVLVANERFAALNVWQIVNALLAVVLLITSAVIGAGVTGFVSATAIAAAATVVALTVHLARGERPDFRFDAHLFKRGVSFASRAYLALLIGFLIQRAAVTLLATYRDAHEIGLFSIAAQIYDVLVIVPTSIGMVLFPMLIRQGGSSWATTKQALGATVVLMSVSCVAAAVLGKPVIPLVFGAQFAPSFDVLLWLLPGVLLISITTVLSQFLVSEGFPFGLVLLWGLGLATCIVAGIPLTRAFGAPGAAAAQSIGTGAVCVGVALLTMRRVYKRNLQHVCA
jgi:O-antigen/teichoic acid export membrane protein